MFSNARNARGAHIWANGLSGATFYTVSCASIACPWSPRGRVLNSSDLKLCKHYAVSTAPSGLDCAHTMVPTPQKWLNCNGDFATNNKLLWYQPDCTPPIMSTLRKLSNCKGGPAKTGQPLCSARVQKAAKLLRKLCRNWTAHTFQRTVPTGPDGWTRRMVPTDNPDGWSPQMSVCQN